MAAPEVRTALAAVVDAISPHLCFGFLRQVVPHQPYRVVGHQQVLQSREAWESIRDWIDQVNPAFSFEVSDRYVSARAVTDAEVVAAQAGREAIIARMNEVFQDEDTVVCLPTTIGPAPLTGQAVSERHTLRLRNSALTSIAGNTGRPQLSLPLAEVDGLPIGLSLLGNSGADAALMQLAQEIAALG